FSDDMFDALVASATSGAERFAQRIFEQMGTIFVSKSRRVMESSMSKSLEVVEEAHSALKKRLSDCEDRLAETTSNLSAERLHNAQLIKQCNSMTSDLEEARTRITVLETQLKQQSKTHGEEIREKVSEYEARIRRTEMRVVDVQNKAKKKELQELQKTIEADHAKQMIELKAIANAATAARRVAEQNLIKERAEHASQIAKLERDLETQHARLITEHNQTLARVSVAVNRGIMSHDPVMMGPTKPKQSCRGAPSSPSATLSASHELSSVSKKKVPPHSVQSHLTSTSRPVSGPSSSYHHSERPKSTGSSSTVDSRGMSRSLRHGGQNPAFRESVVSHVHYRVSELKE
ncbi:hypothetical protein ADUPG1_006733, partial [Aduncisulcus paluster]